jgi:parallel beta-helix repeat protein
MKTRTTSIAILFMATIAVTLKPVVATSETGTITVPDDYQKIQEAINAANPSDTIIVKAGTYNEEYVALDKPVYLFGDNKQSVIIYHSSLGLVITANNVHVAGFTITSIGAGQGHAVDLANAMGCIIEDNLIENNLVGVSVYGTSSGNTISGNVLRDNERSIELIDAKKNTISNNNITNALVSGISLDVSSGNIVSGNRISHLVDGMGALMLWKSSNNVISRNLLFGGNLMLMIECSGNTFSENFVMNSEYGVVVGASSSNSIYGNYFINVTQQVLDTNESGQLSENSWDNDKEGNYWSNYNGADSNGDGIGDSTQVLYENNQDNYPLMNPVDVSEIPEFPSWTSILLICSEVAIALMVYKRKLPKITANCSVNRNFCSNNCPFSCRSDIEIEKKITSLHNERIVPNHSTLDLICCLFWLSKRTTYIVDRFC